MKIEHRKIIVTMTEEEKEQLNFFKKVVTNICLYDNKDCYECPLQTLCDLNIKAFLEENFNCEIIYEE